MAISVMATGGAAGAAGAAGASTVLAAARNLRIQGCAGHPGIRVALRDSGVLSETEFQAKKSELLRRL